MTIVLSFHWWVVPALITLVSAMAAWMVPPYSGQYGLLGNLFWYACAAVVSAVSWVVYGISCLLL
jgi:hypothetical protein